LALDEYQHVIHTDGANVTVLVSIDAFRRGPFEYVPECIDWHTGQHECEQCRNTARYNYRHDNVDQPGRCIHGEDAPVLSQDGDLDKGETDAVA
jgi:hypothetical protein